MDTLNNNNVSNRLVNNDEYDEQSMPCGDVVLFIANCIKLLVGIVEMIIGLLLMIFFKSILSYLLSKGGAISVLLLVTSSIYLALQLSNNTSNKRMRFVIKRLCLTASL